MKSAPELVRLAAWAPKALWVSVILSAAAAGWLLYSLSLQAELLQSGALSEPSSAGYLRVILGVAAPLALGSLGALYLAHRWMGIVLRYLSAKELAEVLRITNWLKWIGLPAAVLQVFPLLHAFSLSHSLSIAWSAASLLMQAAVVPLSWRVEAVITERLRHIAKIIRQERKGSTMTMRALQGQTGPRSTQKMSPSDGPPSKSSGTIRKEP